MKVSARMKIIGAEKGTSREGKPYFVIGLLQGMDAERIYANEEIYKVASGFKPFSDVDCNLSIQIGPQRTFVNLESIQLVDGGKK